MTFDDLNRERFAYFMPIQDPTSLNAARATIVRISDWCGDLSHQVCEWVCSRQYSYAETQWRF